MNGRYIGILIIVVILVLTGGMFLANRSAITGTPVNPNLENTNLDSSSTTATSTATSTATGVERVFSIEGKNFALTPATMTVKVGDTVKITFKNVEGNHDLKIDEFNVATARLKAGEEETITFVADKTGSFEYYCSVGSHRAMGMKGILTVTE